MCHKSLKFILWTRGSHKPVVTLLWANKLEVSGGWSFCGGSAVMNPTSIHKDMGSILGLAQWVKGSSIVVSYGVGCIQSSDPALLQLCCRLAAAALVRPLAWELQHAMGAALKKTKKKKNHKILSGSNCKEWVRKMCFKGIWKHFCWWSGLDWSRKKRSEHLKRWVV